MAFVKAVDAVLEKTESEVTTVQIHKTELLRLKNWLRSFLLRLPTEIIVHIPSHIMEDAEYHHVAFSDASTGQTHRIATTPRGCTLHDGPQ